MNVISEAVAAVAIVTNGLLAGLFFVFVCAAAPGFRRVDDATYVSAFRAINRAILNGWFLSVFLAAPVAAVVSAGLRIWLTQPGTSLAATGAACSTLTFFVTAARNVPLNTRLDRAPSATPAIARGNFEKPWNRWNNVRTITSVSALVTLTLAGVHG